MDKETKETKFIDLPVKAFAVEHETEKGILLLSKETGHKSWYPKQFVKTSDKFATAVADWLFDKDGVLGEELGDYANKDKD